MEINASQRFKIMEVLMWIWSERGKPEYPPMWIKNERIEVDHIYGMMTKTHSFIVLRKALTEILKIFGDNFDREISAEEKELTKKIESNKLQCDCISCSIRRTEAIDAKTQL